MFDAKRITESGLILGLLVLSCLAGCGGRALLTEKTAQGNSRVVAQADRNYRLTVQDFFASMNRSAVMPVGGYLKDADLIAVRDSLVADSLSGFEADETVDLSTSWADNWTYRFEYDNLMFGAFIGQHAYAGVTADSDEVKDFYTKNIQRFQVPEQVEISYILASPSGLLTSADSMKYKGMSRPELEQAAQDYIYHVANLLDSGMPFKLAAATHSVDARAWADSGYAGLTGRNYYRKPFDSVAFSMQPGTYSRPFKDSDGWHIVYVHKHIPGGPKPLDEKGVYESIRQSIIIEKVRDRGTLALDSVSKDAVVKTNDSIINYTAIGDSVTDTAGAAFPDSAWVVIVNETDTADYLRFQNMEETFRRQVRGYRSTPENRREVARALARQLAAVQTARREKLDTIPEVKTKGDAIRHAIVKGVMRRQWYDRSWIPSDSMIEAYYVSHPQEFLVEKPLTVQQIVTKDSSLAIFVRDQARAGVDFIDLAKKYYPGEESVRVELADLGKIGPHDVDTVFYRVAFETQPGEISDPVKTQYGWHVIKVLKHQDSRSLDDARVQIAGKLTQEYQKQQFKEFQNRIFAKYHVTFPYVVKSAFLEPLAYRKK